MKGTILKALAFTVLIVIVSFIGFVRSPRTSNQLTTGFVSGPSNYYVDQSIGIDSNRMRVALSIRSGRLDYIVFINERIKGYPRYAATLIEENKAVGYIMVSSFNDKIKISGTRKAYDISDGELIEHSINIRLGAFDVPRLISLLGTDFSIDQLKQIEDQF